MNAATQSLLRPGFALQHDHFMSLDHKKLII